jgi:hypothetical protein
MGAEGTIKCPLLSKKSKIVYIRLVISLFIYFFATKALRLKFFNLYFAQETFYALIISTLIFHQVH